MDAVGHGIQQVFEELPRCPPVSLVDQLGDRELARAIDADEQVQLALTSGRLRPGGLHLGDVDVEEADRVALKALPLRLVALDVRQAGDAMPLQASVQR